MGDLNRFGLFWSSQYPDMPQLLAMLLKSANTNPVMEVAG